MVRKLFLTSAVALAAQVPDAEVRKVHASAIVLDTHNDVTSRTVDGFDIGKAAKDGHTDIPRMRAGGMGAQFFAVYVAGNYTEGNRSAYRAMEMIDTIRHDIIGRYPDTFEFTTTAGGIEAAKKKGKIAALLGIEGGHAIEDSLRLLRDFYALGVRYMTLTHANNNNWADSSGDLAKIPGKPPGLTAFGRQVVAEMNRLGMMVDISHVSDKTFWDVLETSKVPVIASHSSCRALSNIPRNMSDEMIAALAKKGGVVQINFGCSFVSQRSATAVRSKTAPVQATFEEAMAHIEHAIRIAGVDGVGIGADYDGVTCVPAGLEDVSKYPAITRELLERGYKAEDVRKIMGGNLLRVMRAAEAFAASPLSRK